MLDGITFDIFSSVVEVAPNSKLVTTASIAFQCGPILLKQVDGTTPARYSSSLGMPFLRHKVLSELTLIWYFFYGMTNLVPLWTHFLVLYFSLMWVAVIFRIPTLGNLHTKVSVLLSQVRLF
ncbi:hypothetical protein AMTR_s00135p00105780 [Amborella trichopoda]|uniref:Uncharacterized protein n=1 Tax=Amborella trichopoda TaxID=13333 RepID=W1P7J0_AMBTC|nr:hypothetical protein AMTR_s00135p00105780 [Amborella trichopoda]